jgi:hypothetical protein
VDYGFRLRIERPECKDLLDFVAKLRFCMSRVYCDWIGDRNLSLSGDTQCSLRTRYKLNYLAVWERVMDSIKYNLHTVHSTVPLVYIQLCLEYLE